MIALGILLVIYVTYLAIYPFKVSTVYQPYRVLNEKQQVKRGDDLVFEISYTKYLNVKTTSERSFVCNDGNLIALAASTSNLPVGTHTLIVQVNVPTKTPLGTCVFRQEIEYYVNKLQTQQKTFMSQPFTVLP